MDQNVILRPLAVSWPWWTSVTTPVYPLRGSLGFVIMTCVLIHGTRSALDKESLAINVDGECKKGTSINFNQLT